jgi:hypothetical protein
LVLRRAEKNNFLALALSPFLIATIWRVRGRNVEWSITTTARFPFIWFPGLVLFRTTLRTLADDVTPMNRADDASVEREYERNIGLGDVVFQT